MLFKLLVRPVLSLFPPESSTGVLLRMLKGARRLPLVAPIIRAGHRVKDKSLEKEVFGIRFSAPVGVAAGLDRSGEYADLFSDFGFSFIEIGSLTPLPQDVEPRPRVFTLPRDKALLSRTGNPNKGVQQAISVLSRRNPNPRTPIRIGVNISANARSLTDEAIVSDYRTSFAQMYDFADFFVVNLTDSRRPDAGLQADTDLMSEVLDELLEMRLVYDGYKPILLKISSDLMPDLLDTILDYALLSGIDGIVAGGPAGRSAELKTSPQRLQELGEGGISGRPAFQGMLETVRHISARSKGRLPVVACGGILSPEDAEMALEAGASLVEVYSAIWYQGPKIAKKTHDHILHLHDR
ncbi:MAG: quinone-dependent dihydroorotate dehydrogenase [Bacteroidota bacterium]|nr:quinone-dependent dihydroorotate dehydrogenase [Bacteroidota bacterium]